LDDKGAAFYLEKYQRNKAVFEAKILPTRILHLRRMGKYLIKQFHLLYKFPVLAFLEHISKIMLLGDFELVYWI